MKLSIIIPIYNVEKYLPRCLDSLLRQGLEVGEWEVICVNDGSPDGCAAILADYEKKHPGIFRVMTQENRGVGATRNAGLREAKGEWIGFVDPDDYVIDGGFKYILNHFCETQFDVVHFSCTLVYTDGVSLYDPDVKPDGKIDYECDGAEVYNRMSMSYVWSKFYRRSFLEKYNIRFVADMLEDQFFNFEVFSHSPYLRVVTSNIYRYEQGNVNSILKTSNKELVLIHLNDLYYNMKRVQRFLGQGNVEMSPAIYKMIDSFKDTYNKKMLNVCLTRDEWKRYTKIMDVSKMGNTVMKQDNSFVGKTLLKLKQMALHSYPEYRIVHFLHNNIFKRFVYPRIMAN
ncbi:MAG: glycosyltransferase family 2 protein [Bacteroidales bacterium]|nr:glycosyltransferase family 2 protein [Bacteroidales bacterium]